MKVAIYSLGCKVNIYESEYVYSLLKNHGYEVVSFSEVADIYIINTCSVTNESDRKSRKIIRQARRKNEEAIIVVMGCYSQLNSEDVEADIIIGNKDKSKILEYISDYVENNKKIKKIYDLSSDVDFEAMSIEDFDNHTRAFVKIQDGCNAFCSYCIIPYARGSVRSKKKELVIEEVTNLVNKGYKEIVLTGIHTGRYGVDLGNTNLEDLLRELIQINGLYRIRLSSIEINEITDGIMNLFKESEKLAGHLHIPLQSGCDKILKLMNRRYDVRYFIERIEKIRSLRNDISITTDLIVGFPKEEEIDFKETITTLEKIKFMKIHTFPYSKRAGTPASVMDGQVDGIVKKRRVKQVLDISSKYEKEYYKGYIGQILEGVSELKTDGSVLVHTSNFIPVSVGDIVSNNEIVKVLIEKVTDDNVVFGKIVDLNV